MYSVYIIYSQKIDKYYIGFSSNVQDRLLKHNRNSKGFSNIGKPWILVYEEPFDNKKNAMSRENQLKKSGGSAVRTRQPPQSKNLPQKWQVSIFDGHFRLAWTGYKKIKARV
jgi:putative endonuclease